MSNELPDMERAMVIAAHPDDPEFSAGGTVALLAQRGVEVTYLILTDGSKGSDDRSISDEALIETRREEQREAASRLGVERVIFFDEPDGHLTNSYEVQRDVVRELRRHTPDVVITSDPTRYYFEDRYINHSDHRAAGEIAFAAIFPASQNFRYFPELLDEGFEPHYVREVWISGAANPNFEIDTEETFEQRLHALKAHVSQFGDAKELEETIRRWREEEGHSIDSYRRMILNESVTE